MCGIAGIIDLDGALGSVEQSALARMCAAQSARGPDGSGVWKSTAGRALLGHQRLSIIDLSDAGSQPMRSADGRYVISFNGEIYNYMELRQQLARQGCRFESASDTEVVLQLFARHGPEMLSELQGMFAFGIWDDHQHELFLARDHFGIKPLYYADVGHGFRFASVVKALLAGGGIDTRPAPAGHVGFFLLGSVPEPWTLYRGVRALPAGSFMWVRSTGATEPRSYWDVSSAMKRTRLSAPDESLRDALLGSVRRHLVADVPVGIFLSAGLDSTTLTALACEFQAEPPRTVTLGFREFEGTPANEVPLAESVATRYGTRHETEWVSATDFHAARDDVLAAMDQPSIDGVNAYFVSRATARSGLKVALSGLGADELFGGYRSFCDVPRLARRLRFSRALPRFGAGLRWVTAGLARRMGMPKHAGLLEYGASESGAYLLQRGLFMPWELPGVLDPDLAREGWAELELLFRFERTIEGVGDARSRVSALELSWYMRNQLLRDADWAGMAHSLEIRVPFVDVALFEHMLAQRSGGRFPDKLSMARTPAVSLPDAVLQRPKSGFGIPVQRWLAGEARVNGQGAGLRDWARVIYAATSGASGVSERAEK